MERKITKAEVKRYQAAKARAERTGWKSYRALWGEALKVDDTVGLVVIAEGDGYKVIFS